MSLCIQYCISILIVTIVTNSKADIPNCDYFDTVDISDLKRVNDTYIYNGIKISADRTGEYRYKKFPAGPNVPVKPHLRACVCELIPCVRICCPQKNMLDPEKCDINREISVSMLDLTIYQLIYIKPTKEEAKLATQSNFTEFLVIRDQFYFNEGALILREDEYSLLKDGFIMFHNAEEIWIKGSYCLYPDFSNSLWIVEHKNYFSSPPASIERNKFPRDIPGILFSYIISVFVRQEASKCPRKVYYFYLTLPVLFNLIQILNELSLLNNFCLIKAYSIYFLMMANTVWFSVISFHLWKLLTSMNREEPRYQFVTYSAIGWGTASISTGVVYVVDHIWEDDLHKWNWMPLIGYYGCSIKDFGPSVWIYVKGPVVILYIFNVVMFILTVIHIWKVRSELKRFERDRKRTIQCFNIDTEAFLMFLRISVIMGAILIVNVILNYTEPNSFIILFHYFVHYIVFVLLILKRSTLELLMERIRGRRPKQRPVARGTTNTRRT